MSNFTTDYYITKFIFTIAVLIIELIVTFILKKSVDVLFTGFKHRIQSDRTLTRTRTLRNLFKSVIDLTVFLMALLIILSYWGINIIPILTGASILGLAISFGAQTFIKDVIAGMFIILEDQFHLGDMIQVEKLVGEVVNISLRLTVLRDKKGNLIYIPNSQIGTLIRLKTKAS